MEAHCGTRANAVWQENFKKWKHSKSGLIAAPYLEFPELLLISNIKPIEKYFAFEPRTGTKCQLYSMVTSLRRDAKIEKFDTKTKF
jgi:hypothetical protein